MNKVIIIGATSGIGLELAKIYARKNWLVGATGRRLELLHTLQDEYPDNIIIECFDVTEEENIECIKNLTQQLGGLDLLIYNSGYGEISKNLDWKIDCKTIQTNVNGFAEIVNFTYNYFLMEGKGQIAATSSIAGIRGSSIAPAYSASKAFMSIYMEGLYLKANKTKFPIYISDIQPGFVDTDMAKTDGRFWICPVKKAAAQIHEGIKSKKRRIYISKRWWLIAKLLHIMPISLYKKFA